jgi:hypothetical protein
MEIRMAKVKLRTAAEHEATIKPLQQKCPRLSHCKVILGQSKERNVIALIEAPNKGPLESVVAIHHGRMVQSLSRFLAAQP